MRLSQINVTPVQLSAVFLTHIHGDHTEGLPDLMALRWYLKGPKIEIVCSADTVSIFELRFSGTVVAHRLAHPTRNAPKLETRKSKLEKSNHRFRGRTASFFTVVPSSRMFASSDSNFSSPYAPTMSSWAFCQAR